MWQGVFGEIEVGVDVCVEGFDPLVALVHLAFKVSQEKRDV